MIIIIYHKIFTSKFFDLMIDLSSVIEALSIIINYVHLFMTN